MRKFNDAMNRLAVSAYVKGGRMKQKIAVILARKEGEGFVDTALKILISIVVGALLLAGLYALFKDTILPPLRRRSRICLFIRGKAEAQVRKTYLKGELPAGEPAGADYKQDPLILFLYFLLVDQNESPISLIL